MILITLSTILGGIIIGITCARAVPASFIVELLLIVGVGIMIFSMVSSLRKKGRSSPGKKSFPFARGPGRKMPSDSDRAPLSDSDSSSTHETDGTAATSNLLPHDVPSNVTFEVATATAPSITIRECEKPVVNSQASSICPILERVEQEKMRLSGLQGGEEPDVKAIPHGLCFKDRSGREIRYTLRPSLKKSRSTFLEISVDGKPRKVRKNIMFDNACNSINDGRGEIFVPSKDIALVMKRLSLLSKVASVTLDCTNGAPALREVLSSLDCNGPVRKVVSCGNLSDLRGSTRKLGMTSKKRTSAGSSELCSSFTIIEEREASTNSLMRGLAM